MSTREKILQSIREGGWESVAMPPSFEVPASGLDPIQQFITTLKAIGAECVETDSLEGVAADCRYIKEQGRVLVNCIGEMSEHNSDLYIDQVVSELEKIGYVFIKGVVGVAENGAIWVSEKELVNRLLPFICEHLVMVVHASDIVLDMHEAYQRISIDQEGYGAFIAGPSKTADIEQSLVIGAHGPISMKVFVIR